MKNNIFGRVVVPSLFVLIALLLYFQFLTDSGINENVPLPKELHPIVLKNKDLLIQQAADKGITIMITDAFRSIPEQDKLYEKGRSKNGTIVTHAKGGESYHNFGLAIDFALLTRDGRAIWDTSFDGNGNGKSDWMEVVGLAKSLGFEWGGDWRNFKDYPHLEMRFGLTINELQRGKRPPDQPLTASQ